MAIIDSYSETNQDNGILISGGSANTGAGQVFTANGMQLTTIQFYLKKAGSPTGNMVAFIVGPNVLSGTFGSNMLPSGTTANPNSKAMVNSANVDVTTLTTSYALVTFTFSGAGKVVLTNGAYYFAGLYFPADGGGTNTITMGSDATSPSHSGNHAEYDNSDGFYTGNNVHDICFYVNGELASRILRPNNLRPHPFSPGIAR